MPTHFSALALLTVDVQNQHFIVGRRQVCITRHAYEARVEMLAAHIRKGQLIDGHPIRTQFKGLVQHRVVQVPGHIRCGSSWTQKEDRPSFQNDFPINANIDCNALNAMQRSSMHLINSLQAAIISHPIHRGTTAAASSINTWGCELITLTAINFADQNNVTALVVWFDELGLCPPPCIQDHRSVRGFWFINPPG